MHLKSTERSRRLRERRQGGVVAIIPVEISQRCLSALRRAKRFRAEGDNDVDRQALAKAVQALVNDWVQYIHDHFAGKHTGQQ